MAIRMHPPETEARRARAIQDAHATWASEQVAQGVDGPVPPGRKPGSDWNQHVPTLEADGSAWDDYTRRVSHVLDS